MATYEIKIYSFFFKEIEDLAVKNNVIIKYGATNAFVKTDKIYIIGERNHSFLINNNDSK